MIYHVPFHINFGITRALRMEVYCRPIRVQNFQGQFNSLANSRGCQGARIRNICVFPLLTTYICIRSGHKAGKFVAQQFLGQHFIRENEEATPVYLDISMVCVNLLVQFSCLLNDLNLLYKILFIITAL